MSAREVIEQIKALPPEERAEVVRFLEQLDMNTAPTTKPRYIDQASFKTAKQQVFTKHSELLNKLAK